MKVLGLILELNPFHHGHAYFISEAKRKVNPDLTIAVLSANFSMRGDIMVSNKWDRAQALLLHGVDLVMELPFLSAVNSADYFCYNAVKILAQMQITDLAFGVELADLDLLKQIYELQNSASFTLLQKGYLKKGSSYSGASTKAMLELTSDEVIRANFSLPNNTLALGYLKAILQINPLIEVTLVQRIANQYYDVALSNEVYNSATALRELLKNGLDITKYTPHQTTYYNPQQSEANLYNYLQYLFSVNNPEYFTSILGVDEGIENRFNDFIQTAKTYDEFIKNVQTRRYSYNRIKRIIINIVLGVPKIYAKNEHNYLRILAFSNEGKAYLNRLPKSTKKQIITSFKNNDDYLVQMELKSSKLYSLLVEDQQLYLNEYRHPKGEKNEN